MQFTVRRLLLALMLAAPAVDAAVPLQNGVQAGDVTTTSAVLWARANFPGPMLFEYSTDPTFATNTASINASAVTATRPGALPLVTGLSIKSDAELLPPAKAQLNGLIPNTRYYYRVTDAAGNQSTGRFKTAAEATGFYGLDFGAVGMADANYLPWPVLKNVPSLPLSLFVKLGVRTMYETPAASGGHISFDSYVTKSREVLTKRFGPNFMLPTNGAVAQMDVPNYFDMGALGGHYTTKADGTTLYDNETYPFKFGLETFQRYAPTAAFSYGATGDQRTQNKPKFYRSQVYGKDAIIIGLDDISFADNRVAAVTNPTDPAQMQAFLAAAADPKRTLLGEAQVQQLIADLTAAQQQGIVWKFVTLHTSMQAYGPFQGNRRFEGYDAERTRILKSLHTAGIKNVVFVSGGYDSSMLVNNLNYQESPTSPVVQTAMWDIMLPTPGTDASSYGLTFGESFINQAVALGVISAQQKAYVDSLPSAPDTDSLPNDKGDFINNYILSAQLDQYNQALSTNRYDPVGLNGSPVNATLLAGDYFSAYAFGWGRFTISPNASHNLTVNVYGLPAYTADQALNDPKTVAAMMPSLITKFVVKPQL